jgi:hypothetical protein
MPIQYATADSFRRLTGEQLKPILEILAQVTWPVPEAKIPALINQLGWTWLSDRVHIEADTCLPLNYAIGDFVKPDGNLTRATIFLTDIVSQDDLEAVAVMRAAYPALVADIQTFWGEPSGSRADDAVRTWWDLPTGGRFNVDLAPREVQATLLCKEYADDQRFYEAHPAEKYAWDDDKE